MGLGCGLLQCVVLRFRFMVFLFSVLYSRVCAWVVGLRCNTGCGFVLCLGLGCGLGCALGRGLRLWFRVWTLCAIGRGLSLKEEFFSPILSQMGQNGQK